LVTLFVSLALGCLAASSRAQQDSSIEKFDAVDPYTKGQRELMDRAGYVSFGPFHWAADHSSEDVRRTLDGTPIIFIETAHFRIASTLVTYKVGEDLIEKELIDTEIAALKKKLPKVKATTKLDPWLRAHLYAQRLEAVYVDFCQRFGIADGEFSGAASSATKGASLGAGPYLGQKEKFTVMLAQTHSAFSRYLHTYTGLDHQFSYRFKFSDCYFFGTNFEAFKENNRGFDIALYTSTVGAVVQNMLTGLRDSNGTAPEWLSYGLAHWFGRRIDARWNEWNAGGATNADEDKQWIWEPRVLGLVKNDACVGWEEMMHWKGLDDFKPRDHMIAWSRVDWLMQRKPESLHDVLFAFTEPVAGQGAERERGRFEMQMRAQQKLWSLTPAALDEAWRAWVLKTYSKK
jgi:hypothetical protein